MHTRLAPCKVTLGDNLVMLGGKCWTVTYMEHMAYLHGYGYIIIYYNILYIEVEYGRITDYVDGAKQVR